MLTLSRYRTVMEPLEGRNSRYLSLRWDVRRSMAPKAQDDITTDKSHYGYPFFGDSKLLSVSLQGIL